MAAQPGVEIFDQREKILPRTIDAVTRITIRLAGQPLWLFRLPPARAGVWGSAPVEKFRLPPGCPFKGKEGTTSGRFSLFFPSPVSWWARKKGYLLIFIIFMGCDTSRKNLYFTRVFEVLLFQLLVRFTPTFSTIYSNF